MNFVLVEKEKNIIIYLLNFYHSYQHSQCIFPHFFHCSVFFSVTSSVTSSIFQCTYTAMYFFYFSLLKCAAAAAGVICLLVHYYHTNSIFASTSTKFVQSYKIIDFNLERAHIVSIFIIHNNVFVFIAKIKWSV